MKPQFVFCLVLAALGLTTFGGELEKLFAKPPADAEPSACSLSQGNLFKLKLANDRACIDGTDAIACNRDWPGAKELIRYAARCRALLRAGKAVSPTADEVTLSDTKVGLAFTRRDYEDGTIGYFLACPENTQRSLLKIAFKATGKYPELWDPSTGSIVQPPRRDERDGQLFVTWQADPGASVFVMLRPQRSSAKKEKRLVDSQFRPLDVTGDWTPSPENETAVNGTVYRLADGLVKTDEDSTAFWLDLPDAHGLIEVKVNGKRLATLWKPPYRVEITSAITLEPDDFSIAAGACVSAHAPIEAELKVYGTLGKPAWLAIAQ